MMKKDAFPDLVVAGKVVPCPRNGCHLDQAWKVDKLKDVGCGLVWQLSEDIYPRAQEQLVIDLVLESVPGFRRIVNDEGSFERATGRGR